MNTDIKEITIEMQGKTLEQVCLESPETARAGLKKIWKIVHDLIEKKRYEEANMQMENIRTIQEAFEKVGVSAYLED